MRFGRWDILSVLGSGPRSFSALSRTCWRDALEDEWKDGLGRRLLLTGHSTEYILCTCRFARIRVGTDPALDFESSALVTPSSLSSRKESYWSCQSIVTETVPEDVNVVLKIARTAIHPHGCTAV